MTEYAAQHAPKTNKRLVFGTKYKTPERIFHIKVVGQEGYV